MTPDVLSDNAVVFFVCQMMAEFCVATYCAGLYSLSARQSGSNRPRAQCRASEGGNSNKRTGELHISESVDYRRIGLDRNVYEFVLFLLKSSGWDEQTTTHK